MNELKPSEILLRLSAATNLAKNASDADASKYIGLYSSLMGDGSLVKMGTRIRYNGKLYRARVDLWDSENGTPENAPSLWEEIQYRKGYRIIPEQITAENPFMKGELGWWGDVLKRSIYDGANVWTPDAYAAGWEDVET